MGTKILLIDDDTRILESLARMLTLAGYTVFTKETLNTHLEGKSDIYKTTHRVKHNRVSGSGSSTRAG